jgi:hypothetical protein
MTRGAAAVVLVVLFAAGVLLGLADLWLGVAGTAMAACWVIGYTAGCRRAVDAEGRAALWRAEAERSAVEVERLLDERDQWFAARRDARFLPESREPRDWSGLNRKPSSSSDAAAAAARPRTTTTTS